MGSSNGKQNGEKVNNKRRLHFRRIFKTNDTPRPVSYAGIDRYCEEHEISTRPMSMIDVGSFNNLEINENIPHEIISEINPISQYSSQLLIIGK